MYSMGSGEGMKKHVPKVRFEPCAEAKAVGLEIAKEESLSRGPAAGRMSSEIPENLVWFWFWLLL